MVLEKFIFGTNIYIYIYIYIYVGSVQFTQPCLTPCDPVDCSTPGFPVHHHFQSLLKLMSIESVMPSNHLILCRPLLLPPSIFLSIRVFSDESVLRIRWPKDWSFSFSISLSNEYSGLISLRMDWLDLLAVQGTLKSLLQQHSSKVYVGVFPILSNIVDVLFLGGGCRTLGFGGI